MTKILLGLLAIASGSAITEHFVNLTSGSAPAYWSAECGGRTYVGPYTLMMDWAQCRDYCTYFPASLTPRSSGTHSALLTSWMLTPWSA